MELQLRFRSRVPTATAFSVYELSTCTREKSDPVSTTRLKRNLQTLRLTYHTPFQYGSQETLNKDF